VVASGDLLGGGGSVADGATGVVAVEVTGPGGGSYWREWAAGALVRSGSGKPEGPADLTLGLGAPEARAFWRGEWSPSVAFMRGELKTAGDNGLLLALLAAAARPEHAKLWSVVDASISPG
jgi:hypothetical protein